MADEKQLAACALHKPEMLETVWAEFRSHFEDKRLATIIDAAWKYRQITRGMLARDTFAQLLEDNHAKNAAEYLGLFDDLTAARCVDEEKCHEKFSWESEIFRRDFRRREVGQALADAMEVLTVGKEHKGVVVRGADAAVKVFNEQAASTIQAQSRLLDFRSVSFAEAAESAYIREARGGPAIGTGLAVLDDHTQGLDKGNLVLVGAYAGEGKSFCLLNMGHNAQVVQGLNVAIATGEMTDTEYRSRYLAKHAYHLGYRIPTKGIERAKLTPEQQEQLFRTVIPDLQSNSAYGQLYVWQFGRRETVDSLMRRVFSLPYKIDVLVLDYLSLLSCGRARVQRREELDDIIRDTKQAAVGAYNGDGLLVYTGFQTNRESWKAAQETGEYTKISFAESSEAEKSADLAFWLLQQGMSSELKAGVVKYRHGGTTLADFHLVTELDYAHLATKGGGIERFGIGSHEKVAPH